MLKKFMIAIVSLAILGIVYGAYILGPFRVFLPNMIFDSSGYLILFQNNYELRPTGGFISAYGILRTTLGIPSVNFYDVYGEIADHEYLDPPYYPMEELLGGPTYGGYTFRDSNYFVDFEDSAAEIIKMYNLTNPDARIAGILTVDFSALEDIVGLYEPVAAGEFELTENNLFETLEAEVSDINRHSEEELSARKDIMRDVIKNLIKKIILHPFKLNSLFAILAENFDEKHTILWFADTSIEEKVKNLGWSATMPDTAEDILAVNESNLGGMKNDRYMTRNIKYEVDIRDDEILCVLEITMDHFGGVNIPLSGDYKGYLRAYVPATATLLSGSTETKTENAGDYQSFGDIVVLEDTAQTTLTYRYSLPIGIIEDDTYTLNLIKQPGTNADHYEIIVHTEQGSTLESEDFETREEHAYLSLNLEKDMRISLKINSDENSPRIHSHEIVELNKIYIGFNEPLDCGTAADSFGYFIADTDKTMSGQTDTVAIVAITCTGGDVWLDTAGMTSQDEEFYDVIIRNIRDKHGNYIDPNPRTITVVQRNL